MGYIDWDDSAGRLIYQINQEGKLRNLVDLSRNALRGMIRHAKNGNLLGRPTPYGCDRVCYNAAGKEMCRIRRGERFRQPKDWTAKLLPAANEAEVRTVRWMFETYASTDRSARSLAIELIRKCVKSPNGGEWDWTQVTKLLRNPVYIGWLAYGRRGSGL